MAMLLRCSALRAVSAAALRHHHRVSTAAALLPPGRLMRLRAFGAVTPPLDSPNHGRCFSASAAAEAHPAEEDKMFCYQCEQTTKGVGCTTVGVCGKTPETAALQDLLLYRLKGLAGIATHAKATAGIVDETINEFFNAAIFSTLTNVNFDSARFGEYIRTANRHISSLKERVAAAGAPPLQAPAVPWFQGIPHPFAWDMQADSAEDLEVLVDLGHQIGIQARRAMINNDTLLGLHELITYGLKGAAAYHHHAAVMGKRDQDINDALQQYLVFISSPEAADAGAVLGKALELGATNLAIMGKLEEAHTSTFGHPTPTIVSMTPKPAKAILVSGHDLSDLKALLDQTEGMGIDIYTHGEMLPAHGYPGLSKYPHLKGHYGGAWYRQKIDFDKWPGSILITTNCVLDPPPASYAANLFTTGETGVEGVQHVAPKEFGAVIERAKQLPGFGPEAADAEERTHLVGFGREAMLGAAPALLDAIKAGQLEHIFLIGGCDGSEGSRRYYKNVAQKMPETSAILTLGCAKFRLLGHDYGNLPGTELPRLMDVGQCNDSYAAIQIAVALAEALGTKDGVNGLPLSLDISWFEQKAVAVLLTLLHLGVKDIRLGPALPAFITPDALKILVDTFGLKPADLKNPEEDLERMLMHGQ
mmetsp:Transcript_31589/g.81723  ORF Transcript_31589/g.81723 Transcript_31589/m.81723 type:complete len:646 (+) Transcript_31589:186-2123(+)